MKLHVYAYIIISLAYVDLKAVCHCHSLYSLTKIRTFVNHVPANGDNEFLQEKSILFPCQSSTLMKHFYFIKWSANNELYVDTYGVLIMLLFFDKKQTHFVYVYIYSLLRKLFTFQSNCDTIFTFLFFGLIDKLNCGIVCQPQCAVMSKNAAR